MPEELSPLWKKLLAGKAARRRELAALPFTEKIEIVERLRDLTASLAPNRAQHRETILKERARQAAGSEDPRSTPGDEA